MGISAPVAPTELSQRCSSRTLNHNATERKPIKWTIAGALTGVDLYQVFLAFGTAPLLFFFQPPSLKRFNNQHVLRSKIVLEKCGNVLAGKTGNPEFLSLIKKRCPDKIPFLKECSSPALPTTRLQANSYFSFPPPIQSSSS